MKTRKFRLFLKVFLCIFTAATLSVSKIPHVSAEENGLLSQSIEGLLEGSPDLQGAIEGISIRSATTGQIVYEHQGDLRLRPASCLKLFTAAAALSVLGEDYSFTTEIRTDGKVKGRVLKGNLYVIGKGDPTLLKEDFDKIAKNLRKKGIHSIEGDLVGDSNWYDDVFLSPDLVWSDEDTYYGAQISALTVSPNKDFDAGTVLLKIQPADKIGRKAKVQIIPETNYVRIVNETYTTSPEEKKELKIERKHGTNTIFIKGGIPLETKEIKEWMAVWNPSMYALKIFSQSLLDNGIKLEGKTKEGRAPEKGYALFLHRSIPLSKLVIPFMKLSNNGLGEVLVKEMGKRIRGEGSWEKGITVMKKQLQQFGIQTDTLVIRDGSGISHANLVPANEITYLLFQVQKEPWFHTFLHSLPVGGNPERLTGGTLRNRMKDPNLQGQVYAKTGTLLTVSSLSGYINTKKGNRLIFSILLNNLTDEKKGKEIEDRIIEILADA